MLFVVRCVDKKDHLAVRQENRPTHVEYLKSQGDALFAAGPLLDDAEQMCGSVVILDVADRAAAEAFAAGDPYAKAGLFESVTIDRWNKVLP
ncbi:MAG: hypothetical protein C0622_14635 [Desulfuromonas sp.]|nr:MAG: hypothetical protein C0622_14635 [Desulfuromonas sp.]